MRHWNWDGMVDANRGKLLRLLAGLAALLGSGETVRRVVWRRVLTALVPMESAARRLIYVLARDLTVVPGPARGGGAIAAKRGKPSDRAPVFALTDRRRVPDPPPRTCPDRRAPRILFLDEWVPRDVPPLPSDDDPVAAAALRRRLAALEGALGDLPGQAKRLVRAYARWERMRRAGRHARLLPFRMGRPPGHRARDRRPAHAVLADCHDLAVRCLRMLERETYGR